jgi:hypothetical protein
MMLFRVFCTKKPSAVIAPQLQYCLISSAVGREEWKVSMRSLLIEGRLRWECKRGKQEQCIIEGFLSVSFSLLDTYLFNLRGGGVINISLKDSVLDCKCNTLCSIESKVHYTIVPKDTSSQICLELHCLLPLLCIIQDWC